MEKFLEKLIKYKFLLIISLLIALCLSILSIKSLKIDAIPDITNIQVIINTKTNGLDPEQIERLITFPIENTIMGIEGVDDVRSISKTNLSQITVVFKDGIDIDFARTQVMQRLGMIPNLPQGIKPEIAPKTTALGEILMYRVYLPHASIPTQDDLIYLRTIQDYTIAPFLRKTSGVASIDTNGGYKKEIHINIQPARLAKYGLSLEFIIQKLETIGQNFGGGYIQINDSNVTVKAVSGITNLDDIKKIPLKMTGLGKTLTISDIANVSADYVQRNGAATYKGQEAVLGIVLLQTGSNSYDVTKNVKEAISQITLPDGVAIEVLYDRSFMINASVHTITKNIIEGIIFVIIILFAILRNWRMALIISASIPISCLLAANLIRFFDVSINLMSFGAIDFGLLVDGSVVMVEHIMYEISKNTSEDKQKVVIRAAKEVIWPVIIGISVILMVYLPLMFFTGVEGRTFKPMAMTVICGLVCSLIVAVFIMPVLSYMFLKVPTKTKQDNNSITNRFFTKYDSIITSISSRFYILLTIIVVIIVSTFLGFHTLPMDFIPSLHEGDVILTLVKPITISTDKSIEIQKKSEEIILKHLPNVEVFSRIGSTESGLDAMSVNVGDIFIIPKKSDINHFITNSPSVLSQIENEIRQTFEGVEVNFSFPAKMRFNEVLDGTRADISMKLIGINLQEIFNINNQIMDLLSKNDKITSVSLSEISALTQGKSLQIIPNYQSISNYDLGISQVNRAITTAMSGYNLGILQENNINFPIILHMGEGIKNNPEEIANIPVNLAYGGFIPLKNVTTFKFTDDFSAIPHSFTRRHASLSITLQRNVDPIKFVNDTHKLIKQNIILPNGYYIEWGGKYKNIKSAKDKIVIAVPIIILMASVLMWVVFRNIARVVVVLLLSIISLSGGIIGLYLNGMPLSISAIIGFIVLFGVNVLNAVVMISYLNKIPKNSTAPHIIILMAAKVRFKPIMCTAVSVAAGFIPMLLNAGIGHEAQLPIATVVVWGSISATITTLCIMPAVLIGINIMRKNTHL